MKGTKKIKNRKGKIKMSNWQRKPLRKRKRELKKFYCCGQKMTYKTDYGYVCEICGKLKVGE